jgi:hypothetical protein
MAPSGPRRQDANRTEADDDGALENNGVAVALHRVPHVPTRLAAAVTHTHVDVVPPILASSPSLQLELIWLVILVVLAVRIEAPPPVWVRWWLMCSRLLA